MQLQALQDPHQHPGPPLPALHASVLPAAPDTRGARMRGGSPGARAPDHLAGGGAARGQRGAQQEAGARAAGTTAAEAEQEAG